MDKKNKNIKSGALAYTTILYFPIQNGGCESEPHVDIVETARPKKNKINKTNLH